MTAHANKDKELFHQIAEGSQEYFTVLYNRYHQKVYALAFHLTRSQVASEEIVQDVFLKVWLNQQSLPQLLNFESWLFITARNHIYTYLKRSAREMAVVPLPEDHVSIEPGSVESTLHYKEFESILSAAISQLPPQQYQVYNLSREQNLGREAIASQLGLSPETVKVHLSRAMRSIRAYITARLPLTLLSIVLFKLL